MHSDTRVHWNMAHYELKKDILMYYRTLQKHVLETLYNVLEIIIIQCIRKRHKFMYWTWYIVYQKIMIKYHRKHYTCVLWNVIQVCHETLHEGIGKTLHRNVTSSIDTRVYHFCDTRTRVMKISNVTPNVLFFAILCIEIFYRALLWWGGRTLDLVLWAVTGGSDDGEDKERSSPSLWTVSGKPPTR